jgi:eukaryotic-like serine/threonine-protein kinase
MTPQDDDAARREQEIERLARCVADDEPLSDGDDRAGTHFKAFVELKEVIDGFREVQQRFANRRPSTAPSFKFGQLEVLEKLGEGAQAEVYRAYDPVLDQFFALKIRRAEFGALSNDFLEEARHLARVHHPNVVRVYGAANVEGRAGLWTELVNGQTLESLLTSNPILASHDAVEIGNKLCDALAALHTRGIVHGDIKPSNVMLEDSGRVVLMDFGAAQQFRTAGTSSVMVGTLPYLAPELLRGDAHSPQSDVYALGVLMFRLLTGTFPYSGADATSLSSQQNEREPPKISSLAAQVPTVVAKAVERAIAIDPRQRHRGAAAFASALHPSAPRYAKAGLAIAISLLIVLAVLVGSAWISRKNLSDDSDIKVGLVRETANEGRETLQSGSAVSLGDEIAIEFKSTFPAYVYIFGSSENNKATVLFPILGAFPANPLAPGTLHHIPGSIDGRLVDWQVVTDAPSEEIVVLVAREPQPDLDREIARLDQANAGDSIPSLPRSMSKLVPAPEILTIGNPYLREVLAKTRLSDAANKIRVWDFRLPHAQPLR